MDDNRVLTHRIGALVIVNVNANVSILALIKDTALALAGSQPRGWESILGGSASSSLTRGRTSFEYIPSLEAGNEATQAFDLFLVSFAHEESLFIALVEWALPIFVLMH
ncbi:MAG: hypothetical protein ACYTX0_44150 [Nostoc sp.]